MTGLACLVSRVEKAKTNTRAINTRLPTRVGFVTATDVFEGVILRLFVVIGYCFGMSLGKGF